MAFDLKTAIGTLAPTLATMLGGPLAGTAVTALASAMGLPGGATAQAVSQVLESGKLTGDQIAAIKAADQKHAEILGQQGIDLAKINADHAAAMETIAATDRASARDRETKVGGWTTPVLAWSVVGASLGLALFVVSGVFPKDPTLAATAGVVMGYVFGEAKTVLAYYFGSSVGSERKTELLAQSAPAER